MRKNIKKIAAMILVFTIIFSSIPVQAATSARFSSSGSYCEVRINQSLLNKNGRQYATVKLNTYNQIGWNSSAKVVVTLKDSRGNTIWSGVKTASCTLQLGDDHSVYRIYVKPYQQPVTGNILKRSIIAANNFENQGKCVTWKISNNKNCTIR